MTEIKKRKIIILNKEKQKFLIDLLDYTLKGGGVEALPYVNAVAGSVEEEELPFPIKGSKKSNEINPTHD